MHKPKGGWWNLGTVGHNRRESKERPDPMTYLFKLVRRLAISRDLGVLAGLALVAACAADSTAPEGTATRSDSVPASLQISPRSVTIETSQSVVFRSLADTSAVAPVVTPLAWKATGGTMRPNGAFSSAAVGTFKIFGRGRGWRHTDTAIVHVVAPQPDVVRISLSPRAVTVSAGAERAFTATGYRRNGSPVPLGLTWSATGGTVDPAGAYIADTLPGLYRVIASNTAGTVADTADVTVANSSGLPGTTMPAPLSPSSPPQVSVIVSPASVTLAPGARKRFRAYGLTGSGDSVDISVTFKGTGGTITADGLYTAGRSTGSYNVIASARGHSDTALVTLTSAPAPAPTPVPSPTPAPPPVYTGQLGVPVGTSGLLSAGVNFGAYSMSLDSYTKDNIVSRLAYARANKHKVLMNMTGGAHNNYKTNGKFDITKWQAKMNTFNTPTIKQAVAAAVADGTIVGNSVMDEPQQAGTSEKAWGPAGFMTKAKVDDLCARVKAIFPTMPTGVVHDHRVFEPEKNYAVCDFIVSQYRAAKAPVTEFRDGGVAFAKRSRIAIAFSLNVLHGGTPSTTCTRYGDEAVGTTLCPMTPEQIRSFGVTLGTPGCALNMWRYEEGYFNQSGVQAAVRTVGETLAQLPRKGCTRI